MTRDLEVRHCRALLAVHDCGGVGAAARVLGVAQSTVSETLLALERLLGVPVTLRRAGRETTLTAAAELLLPHARALIAAAEGALAANARQSRATIRLGTVESVSSFLLPAPLRDFRMLWPQVEVRIAIGLCEDLRRRVGRSELDAALTIEGAEHGRDRDSVEECWPAQLRLIAAPGYPLARSVVGRHDLAGRTCLLTDHDGAFNALVKSWVGSAEPSPRLESAGSVDGVKRGVLKSDAIGVLPDYAVVDELAERSLVALNLADPLPSVSLRMTTLQALEDGSPLEDLIGKIRNVLRSSKSPER